MNRRYQNQNNVSKATARIPKPGAAQTCLVEELGDRQPKEILTRIKEGRETWESYVSCKLVCYTERSFYYVTVQRPSDGDISTIPMPPGTLVTFR